jgi:glycolate oxidase iron-sulfur subunit
VNRDTVSLLAHAGYESRTAPGHVCCGALHAHNGDLEGARDLARGTIAAFDALVDDAGAPLRVVVNSAGCGAHMKAYGHLLRDDPAWRERAERFAARVVDLSEALAPEAGQLALRLPPGAVPGPIAYDDPCHLCHGQGVRAQPRALLDRVEGLERVEMPESEGCCGSAGIYSVLRPADSQAVFARKLETLAECGAKALVTANPGCQLQWESGLARAGSDVQVLHLAELLARALPEEGSREG